MNNFMKTIINGLKTWTLSRIKNSRGNWNQNDKNADDYIKNRPFYTYDSEHGEVVKKIDDKYLPDFATVATSGNYNDLTNKPNLAYVATSGDYYNLINRPNLASVATSGNYNDLTNRPIINTSVVRYDTSQYLSAVQKGQARQNIGAGTSNFSGSYNDLSNKPVFADVATNGSYLSLTDKPNNFVKHDAVQDLPPINKYRARTNIGAIAFDDIIGSTRAYEVIGSRVNIPLDVLGFTPVIAGVYVKYDLNGDIVEASADGDRFDGWINAVTSDGTGEYAIVFMFGAGIPNNTATIRCYDETVTNGFYDFVMSENNSIRLATDSDDKHNIRRLLVLKRNTSSIIEVVV